MNTKPETREFLAATKHEVRSAHELLEALAARNALDAELLALIRAANEKTPKPPAGAEKETVTP